MWSRTTVASANRPTSHDRCARNATVDARAGQPHDDRLGRAGRRRRDLTDSGLGGAAERQRADPVDRASAASRPARRPVDRGRRVDAGRRLHVLDARAAPPAAGASSVQAAQALERGEPPLLLAAGEAGKSATSKERSAWTSSSAARPVVIASLSFEMRSIRARSGRRQPTAPSICSSIRRLSSRAYSIGSSRAIGSTKPRTIIAIASSSVMPRLIR